MQSFAGPLAIETRRHADSYRQCRLTLASPNPPPRSSVTMVSDNQVKELLAPLLLKDLRIQCRARGLNPGGSRPALVDRVHEHMMATGDL